MLESLNCLTGGLRQCICSDKELTLKKSALGTLYGGKFTIST